MGRGPTAKYHRVMADGYVAGTLTCLTAETIMAQASPDFPLVLNIEPTNVCNLKCTFCAAQQKRIRPKGLMRFDLYKQIIDECREHRQLRMLNLHKDGESFVHGDIIEMIRYASRTDCAKTIHLNTNGTFFQKDFNEQLLFSGLDDLTVSIDAYEPSTYYQLKGKDMLANVIDGTLALIKRKQKLNLSKPHIRVKIMEFAGTIQEVEPFVKFWTGKADEVQVTGIHDWSGGIEGLIVTDEAAERTHRWPCVLLWYMLAVNWDGQVSICNLDWNLSGTVGNVLCESLSEIWQGEKIKAIRRAELKGRHDSIQVCDKCILWAGAEDMTDWLKEQKEYL